MKKIIRFFTNPIVISLIGLVVLSLLIWFGGPYIKFGETNAAPLSGVVTRLIVVMVLVAIWGLNNLRKQFQNTKQNNELVDDIEKSHKQSKAELRRNAGSEQAAEEINQMNQRFTQALATLKKLKFQGGGSAKALYELPWYIIVGPPGSGKTTALVNSGLDFPLAEQFGKGALQGVGGTRNCDWWFTNDAVLIDTAGRYTTQDSHRVVDSSAWEGFLNLLKRNRRRRPINGAIVAISLHDLLLQTEEERILHAKTIRSRLDELMEKLQIRFPIYLMFTKADLVSGFSEFYEDLGREDREQVWGVSLPNAPQLSQSPDFEYLEKEMKTLVSRLYDRVLWRMHQERDTHRRGAIYGFPQQMENLTNIVDSFVRQTFTQNRYRFQPYLRGVYFSSGTQDGTPIDRLMSSVSANFGFSRESAQAPNQQGKSFFLSRLFREVIFPESELVGSNVRYESFIRWAQRGAFIGLAGITVLVVLVWSGSITRHKLYMSEVGSYIKEFETENNKLSRWNKDVRAVIPALNALAKASIVYDQEEHPWLSGIGLYDGRVDIEANIAYEEYLQRLLLPRLISDLELSLNRGHQGGDLYNTFRVYIMFNKRDKMDRPLISEWFETNWESQFHGEATRRQELKAHLIALLALDLAPVELNKRLVSQTRSLLLRVPVSKRIYSRIKTSPDYVQPVDMLNHFGESVRAAYKVNAKISQALSVPAMFTVDGYENIDFSAGAPVIADIVKERWVLSDDDKEKVDFINEDLDEISAEVKDHYLSDYASVWSDVYRALEVKEFKDLREAQEILSSFSDPVYSPLRSILQVGLTHTQLTSPVIQDLAEGNTQGKKGKALGFIASKVETTKVDRRFHDLNILLKENARSPAVVDSILQRIGQMQEYVAEISFSPDPSKKSFEIAKARFQSGAASPISSLNAYAQNMPEPVERWLTTLSNETWKVILRSAHEYVASEWRNQVYTPYSRGLAGRYPLKKNAIDELALFDFSEFFKPNGTVDAFYLEFIKPFVNTRKNWNNKVVDKYSIGYSSAALKQIRHALSIRDVFFQGGGESPSISLELRPRSMSEDDARFILELGEERLSYKHGPKFWKPVNWSGEDGNSRVRVIFEGVDDSVFDKTYVGPWAWFRLMDASSIKKTSRSNVYELTFQVDDQGEGHSRSIVYEGRAKSVNNPFTNDTLGSFRCPEAI
ncbi:type VI secretion system membrane subunit TssM [Teredinibacter haidensis]|uniref:type VI secretion system membrane subunit TssM n=1 Tax=Teredinibacter haidensis TaxID=2731755 RepID=UPI000948EA0C|nr:type VI secretion system membrane subunit TssM [Teredinibacter haidensis]